MKTERVYNTKLLKIDMPVIIGKNKERANIETIYTDVDIACDNGYVYNLSEHKISIIKGS